MCMCEYPTIVDPKWFINLTNVDIPNDICWLLSLGPKFSLPIQQKEFPIFKFIADIENVLTCDINEESRETKRSKVSHLLNKQKFSNEIKSPIDAEIIRIYKNTHQFFNRNKDLVIVLADKGNRTVVMTKTDYKSKMFDLLSDQNTYRSLPYDTSDALHARLIYMATRLKKNKWINEEDYNKIVMYNSAMPKIYGQPKVHKPQIPHRPVVASYESPNYKASSFLAEILKHLTKHSKYNIKNAFEFVERVSKLKLNHNELCVSFDVVSLFTNVPLDLIEQILKDRWNEIQLYTSIPETEFFQMLNFVLRDCNQFIYNNTIYKQLDGVPMGLPLSPILADIVMEYILDMALSKLNYHLTECIKYVDDLFLIIPKHLIHHTLAMFNSIHPKIQFTHELENHGELPFLDVLVLHNHDGSIEFNWYSKPTSSDRLLSYLSNHPINQKLNVIDNLIRRVFGLSSKRFHHQNSNVIKSLLISSNYPLKLIKQRIKKYFCAINSINNSNANVANSQSSQNVPNETQYRGLHYSQLSSLNIGKLLCKDIPQLRLGYKPIVTNRSVFSKPKQKTSKGNMYNVVYKIPCYGDGFNAICDDCYVGTTGHKLNGRTDQHVDDIKSFNLNNDLDGTTALVHHYYEAGHVPNIDEVSILAVEHNYTKRKVLESLHILSQPNTINFRRDTDNISTAYKSLLS